MTTHKVIDGDGHVTEPPHLVDYVEAPYRDLAPRVVTDDSGYERFAFEGKLSRVEVRLTKVVHSALGERGYSPFIQIYWDVASDLLTYNIRDGARLIEWSAADALTYFSPDFMRRQWYLVPVRSYLGVNRPEEFFLRPGLELGKFPQQRSIELPAALVDRIRAQDEAGRLVFSGQPGVMPNENGEPNRRQ